MRATYFRFTLVFLLFAGVAGAQDRRIVLKDGVLTFANKGKAVLKTPRDPPPAALAVSPNGQLGAALISSPDLGTVLEIYRPDRTKLRTVKIADKPYVGRLSIADDGMAVVSMTMTLNESKRMKLGLKLPKSPIPPKDPVAIVSEKGAVARWRPDGGLILQAHALGGRQWIAESTRKTGGVRLQLFKGLKPLWKMEFPLDDIPTTWVERGEKTLVGVQTKTYLKRFTLDRQTVEEKKHNLSRGSQ